MLRLYHPTDGNSSCSAARESSAIMADVPAIVLSTGGKIPLLGMGTATSPQPPDETITSAVLAAIELGYRHFDTAAIYGSELAVGRGIAAALERGLIGSRDELFVTTKLWCTDAYAEGVVPALQQSLGALGLDFVDLYLIHYPVRLKGEKTMIFSNEAMIPVDIPSVWEGMERCQRLGLAKSIGVSNFTIKKLVDLLEHAKIPPAVNQVEVHIMWQQKKLRDFCSERGIHVTAYSPLGGIGVVWGTNALFECDEIKRVAQSTGKTIAQVCLRWVLEQGVSIVVKSYNKERLKEDMQIFDWSLNEEDAQTLSQLPQQRYVVCEAFVSPDGIYKTQADFWDGDM